MPVQADPTTPPALIVAAIVYFLLAFGALIPGALAFSIAINSTQPSDAIIGGAWNVIIGVVYIFVGVWILRRERRGYNWGVGSAGLSLIGSIVQAFLGTPPLLIFIPFYVVALVLLVTNRKAFTR